jgi:4-hydroxy-tetrahydrodipicolinate synthase
VISVLSNVAPRETHDMVAKFLEGDVAGAREIQLKAIPLISALFSEVNPIPVKAAMALRGEIACEYRLPLCEMTSAHLETLSGTLKKCGAL